MTLIAFQDGSVVMHDGKVGSEQACCCGAGACCYCNGPEFEWRLTTDIEFYSTCQGAAHPRSDAENWVAAYVGDANTFADWLRSHGWLCVSVISGVTETFYPADPPPDGPCATAYSLGYGYVIVKAKCCGNPTEDSTTCHFFQGRPRTAEADSIGTSLGGANASDLYFGCDGTGLTCVDSLTKAECDALCGGYQPGQSCAANPCEPNQFP